MQISEAQKQQIRQFQQVYARISSPQQNAGAGIYPVIVNGQVRGVRLGKETPATANSICLIAGTHQNELGGWAAQQAVLEQWDKRLSAVRNRLPGDIYLLFGGEKEQVESFFSLLTNPNLTEISDEELTRYRCTDEGANRNRVQIEKPVRSLPHDEQELVDDYSTLNAGVFPHCKLVLDIHSLSQEGPSLFIPLPQQDRSGTQPEATHAQELVQVTNFLRPLAERMGAQHMLPDASHNVNGRMLVDEQNPRQSIRALFEGGGPHLDPQIWQRCRNAALGAISASWAQLNFLTPPLYATPKPVFHGVSYHLYLPNSPNAHLNPPEDLFPAREADNAEWHLLAGGKTPLPVAVQAKLQLLGLPADYAKNRLVNGAMLQGGEPIAYACDGNRVSLMCAPQGQDISCFMFPADGTFPPDRPESIGLAAYPLQRLQQRSLPLPATVESLIERVQRQPMTELAR